MSVRSRRRTYPLALLAVAPLVLLAACGGDDDSGGAAAGEEVELRLAHSYTETQPQHR
jgi:TRAP-type transport system periplasmic protein